ncbi:MAG: DUF378 domain-containing protein [Candidatus Megaira endosymbiont of Carteria cerasiformis]|nr:DUF378 domain-containing protein [Candidatus Megaera polyxenophila]
MIINTSINPFTTITTILAAIGAINWGLVGIFDFNLVSYLLGETTTITKIVYSLVGISGLYSLICLGRVLSSPGAKDAS